MYDLRNLPPLPGDMPRQRENIKQLLMDEMYGSVPGYSFEYERSGQSYIIQVNGPGGTHNFSFRLSIPEKVQQKSPVIIYLTNPYPGEADIPVEILTSNGFAVAICHANEIEPDEADGYPKGLGKVLSGANTQPGALAVWAEGSIIAAKILKENDNIDSKNMIVAGCSRFGKAALWAGAKCENFSTVVSFDSGCGGAAINRGKRDEHISDMARNFPHWLSPNMKKYIDNEDAMPFDQHFLLGLIAPRKLLVTSSTKDPYCDPYSEFLGLAYASSAYEDYGKRGIGSWIQPPPGKLLIGDGAAYYLRCGNHGVEIGDWTALIEFYKEDKDLCS
ncbi:MAG: hypothetical protein J1F63_10000 [Oscillospiraceae bacterium]|nr:hypothetical protein [Oscillospiraceae bacterium]